MIAASAMAAHATNTPALEVCVGVSLHPLLRYR